MDDRSKLEARAFAARIVAKLARRGKISDDRLQSLQPSSTIYDSRILTPGIHAAVEAFRRECGPCYRVRVTAGNNIVMDVTYASREPGQVKELAVYVPGFWTAFVPE